MKVSKIIITREEMNELLSEWCQDMQDLVGSKNQDYANSDNAFSNFNAVTDVDIHVSTGIHIRMMDKFERLSNFHRKGFFAVEDESVKDTLLDMANYCFLQWLALEKESEDKPTTTVEP